jgi:nucleoside-diphosphate-sugar epimerase
MVIAVVGGTGTIGRPLVELLTGSGHQVRALSRSARDHPVDLCASGEKLALSGRAVVAFGGGPSCGAPRAGAQSARPCVYA